MDSGFGEVFENTDDRGSAASEPPTPSLDRLAPAAATVVGSMPGTSVRDSVALIVGELTTADGVPHLPELPSRGPGSDMIGRTGGLLAGVAPDLALETTPDGWRFADAPGRDMRRASSWLGEDLDAWEEALESYDGVAAVSLAGPWTMAASIELHFGERALKDAGACRDLAGALAHAAADHVAELRRRLPKAQHWIWLDEPVLNSVLLGSIPTQSGRGRIAAIEPHIVEMAITQVLEAITAAGASTAIHCCEKRPPLALLRRTPADALSIDMLTYSPRDDDELGELIQSGRRLIAGIMPGTDTELSGDIDTVAPLRQLGGRLGFDEGRMASSTLISPTCGFAGASPAYVRSALARLTSASRTLRDEELRGGSEARDER